MVLGIESSNFDSSIRSFARNEGFEMSGVDCVVEGTRRTAFREGFSYYSGLSPNRIPGRSSDRSRFVVINGVTGSSSHEPWQVLFNANSVSNATRTSLMTEIDSVMPGNGTGNSDSGTYAAWIETFGLDEALVNPGMNPDDDDLDNLLEFYFNTSPVMADGSPLSLTRDAQRRRVLQFAFGKAREGLEVRLEGSADLQAWEPVESASADTWNIVSGEDEVDHASVVLPQDAPPYVRLRVAMATP